MPTNTESDTSTNYVGKDSKDEKGNLLNKLTIAEGALEDSAEDKRYLEYFSSQKKDNAREKRILYREKSFLNVVGLTSFHDQFWVHFHELTIASGHVCCESIEKIRNKGEEISL